MRDVHEWQGALADARRTAAHGYAVRVLHPDVDLTTPNGRLVARVIVSVSERERETISQRTTDALAVKRAQGTRLGAPVAIPDAITRRVVAERASGRSLERIAEDLNTEGIPTPRGAYVARKQPATPRRARSRVTLRSGPVLESDDLRTPLKGGASGRRSGA